MVLDRLTQLRRFLEALFPERHLYLRSGGEMRGMAPTADPQVAISGAASALGPWLGDAGSTGRSTRPHLHHEGRANGRPQNPERFLEAG